MDNPALDLALIQVENFRSDQFFSFSSIQRRGEDIFMWGYPGVNTIKTSRTYDRYRRGQAVAPEPTHAKGTIQSLHHDKGNGLELLQHSSRGEGGNSGSPIINKCGQVSGIHFSGRKARGDRFAYGYSTKEILKHFDFNKIGPFKVADKPCPL